MPIAVAAARANINGGPYGAGAHHYIAGARDDPWGARQNPDALNKMTSMIDQMYEGLKMIGDKEILDLVIQQK